MNNESNKPQSIEKVFHYAFCMLHKNTNDMVGLQHLKRQCSFGTNNYNGMNDFTIHMLLKWCLQNLYLQRMLFVNIKKKKKYSDNFMIKNTCLEFTLATIFYLLSCL